MASGMTATRTIDQRVLGEDMVDDHLVTFPIKIFRGKKAAMLSENQSTNQLFGRERSSSGGLATDSNWPELDGEVNDAP